MHTVSSFFLAVVVELYVPLFELLLRVQLCTRIFTSDSGC